MTVTPPRLAERLARLLSDRAQWDDAIGGDLREEFAAVAGAEGPGRARAWYWRQVLDLAGDAGSRRARSLWSFLRSVARPEGDSPMRSLGHEIRPAVRSLLRQPLSAAVIVLTLAVGLGTNAAVLGMADALVLRPFPFQGVGELVAFAENRPDDLFGQYEVAPGNYLEWKEQATSFSEMGAFTIDSFNFAGADRAERIDAGLVSGEFFSLLRITPAHGRLIDERDQAPGGDRQVVLADALWQRRFAGDPAVIGRTITLDGVPYTVVGIAPAGFDFPSAVSLWAPLALAGDERANRRSYYLTAFGRLAPGVSFEEAAAEMETLHARQREAHPNDLRDRRMWVQTFSGAMIDAGLPRILVLWQIAALLVLAIGCANVANLLLARGATRQRELAVRTAIGASRWRLIRQLLVESLVLAAIAAPVALMVASASFGVLRGAMPAELVRYVAGWDQMGVDWRLGLVTLAIAFGTALVFGALPALQASRPSPHTSLKDGGRSVVGSRGRLRRSLVVVEVAIAVPLLVVSGMAAVGARQFASGPQGYDPDGVLRLRLVLPTSGYPDAESRRRVTRQLVEQMRAIAGVEDAASASVLPSSSSNQRRDLRIDGRPIDPARIDSINFRSVTPSYFDLMRIPVPGGRGFGPSDRADAEPVAIVSQAMAERYWPGESPIGARIKLGAETEPWTTIVGVTGDTIDDWFSSRRAAAAYVPAEQVASQLVNLVLRSTLDPAVLADSARDVVARVDPTLAPFDVGTMIDAIRVRTTGIRFIGAVMMAFGVIALVLAAVGVYGVMAYSVAERRQEIGIRMALGATASHVLRQTVQGGGRMAALGIALGLGMGFLLARLMESALFGVVALEWWLFAAISAILASVALVASFIPARQAAHMDPVSALRAD